MTLTALAFICVSMGVGQPAVPGATDTGGLATGSDYQVAKTRSLQIGIDYKPERKKDIQSVVLYMSRDQGNTWELVAQEPPTKTAFNFTAPDDGIYFLNMMIMYLDGKKEPSDISRVPPAQKLIIDTTKPVVRITNSQRTGDEVLLEWAVDDKNPNDSTTKVFYKTAAGDASSWQTVPSENMNRRSAKFMATLPGPIVAQVVTSDLAGHVGFTVTRELAPSTTTTAYTPPAGVAGPSPVPPRSIGEMPPTLPVAPDSGSTGVGLVSGSFPGSGLVPAPATPGLVPSPAAPAVVMPPSPTPPTTIMPPTPGYQFTPVQPGMATSLSGHGRANDIGAMPVVVDPQPKPIAMSGAYTTSSALSVPTSTTPPEVSPIQYSKTPRFDMGYQLDAGPSGVKQIDLYVSRDDGKNWTRWSTHDGRESPLKVALDTRFNLSVDGEYGFKLVAVSGAGLSEGSPAGGTSPDARVLVDTVAPVVKVFQPTADPMQKNALVLHWEATDKNFGKDPVAIEYSEAPAGPWKPVTASGEGVVQAGTANTGVARIPNSGTYSWQLPTTLTTPRVYLKFTVQDLAGNKSEVATPNPVLVDLKKPIARVQGIMSTVER